MQNLAGIAIVSGTQEVGELRYIGARWLKPYLAKAYPAARRDIDRAALPGCRRIKITTAESAGVAGVGSSGTRRLHKIVPPIDVAVFMSQACENTHRRGTGVNVEGGRVGVWLWLKGERASVAVGFPL